MKKISIGSWAYSIGPYEKNPVPWDDVVNKLKALNFDGVELGGFGIHPNPDIMPRKEQRDKIKEQMADLGLGFSGLAANLWGEHLIDTEDTSAYIECFGRNVQFCLDLDIPAIRWCRKNFSGRIRRRIRWAI